MKTLLRGVARNEIVFVANPAASVHSLPDGVRPGEDAEVHVIAPVVDGLARMADVLRGRSDIDAIHIVSDSQGGRLQLGSAAVTAQGLPERSAQLALIGGALSWDADILLYAQGVAHGTDGEAFMEALAQAAQRDFGATGARDAVVGVDWLVETVCGSIDDDIYFCRLRRGLQIQQP